MNSLDVLTKRVQELEETYRRTNSFDLGGVPAGMIAPFGPYGGTSAPGGWLLCNGSSLLRADYPVLFAVIGTSYGSIDGSHFTLPNLTALAGINYFIKT